MRRSIVAIALVSLLFAGLGPAAAQTFGGGLAALPAISLSSDLLKNSGFETLTGGLPTGWSAPSGWAADQLVKRSGSYSYRRGSGADTSVQTVALKKGVYNLSGWLKTSAVGSGTSSGMRLQLDLRPTISAWYTTDVISGTADWTFYEVKNVVVPQDMTVSVKLENYNGAVGTAWFDDMKLVQQLPQGVDVFMLYPNFRGMLFDDGPSTVKLDVTVTPPGGDFARYTVSAALKDEATGATLTTQSYPASTHLVAELSGVGMQTNRPYLATVTLVDQSTGSPVYTYPAYRVSRVPAGARATMNVSFDEKNRVLLKGQPRFVLGVYDSGGGYSSDNAFWENQIWSPTGDRGLQGLRINMYLNYWMGEAPAASMDALEANLASHGVSYLQTGNCFSQWAAGTNFLIHSSDAYVKDIGSQPGNAGYYTADECNSTLMPGIFNQYVRLRQLDTDSMTFAALFADSVGMWRDAADVLSTDPYPMYGAEPAGGYNHGEVAAWTAATRDGVKDARPYMTVLQFFQFTSFGRWPTLAEMRAHAYMAIVEGAKGLWWWSVGNGDGALATVCSGWCAQKTTYLNNLKSVVGELADLEPALLADDAPGALAGNSQAAIKTKVKVVSGRGYVFAYNSTNASVTSTFTWNTAPGTVTVNAESRSLTPGGNSFTDTFGPFAAHVYVIGNGGTGGTTPPPAGAPTVSFTNPAAGATVSGTTTVTMAASGGSGSYTYKLAVDGSNVYTGTNPSFSWNTTTIANGAHALTATATDSAGQSGTATRSVTVSNTTTTPPPPPATGTLQVFITSPTAGTTVSGLQTVNVWLSGASGTSNTYTLTVGGLSIGSTTISGTHAVMYWDTAKVADGSQTLTAKVKDATGNTGAARITVTTKNGVTSPPPPPPAPSVSFTAPASGATVSGTTTVSMTASGGSGSGYTYALALDGVTVASRNTYSWNTTTSTNGGHTLTATVKDSAGATATASRTVTVSNTTPPPATGTLQVFITSPTAGTTVSGLQTVNVWLSGASGTSNTYTLTVGGLSIGSTTISGTHAVMYWDTAKVADGSQTLTAKVKDATGNTGAARITVTTKNGVASTTPPPAPDPAPAPGGTLQVYITSPTAGSTVSGTQVVNVWLAGQSGTSNAYTVMVDGKVVGAQTSSGSHVYFFVPTTGYTNGAHTITAAAKDATGNTGTSSITVTVRN